MSTSLMDTLIVIVTYPAVPVGVFSEVLKMFWNEIILQNIFKSINLNSWDCLTKNRYFVRKIELESFRLKTYCAH